jgi:hypothetical protein
MPLPRALLHAVLAVALTAFLCPDCLASAFVRGAYYRLGDADPGAAAASIGANPTLDSFGDGIHLARFGNPRYSADVPPLGPAGNKLAMAFANEGLGGPAFPGSYGRAEPLPMVEQGMALEAWVRAGPTNLDRPGGVDRIRNEMLAYNGDPDANGFGFFLHDANYVLRLGMPNTGFERVLGPADTGAWHHLAYVRSLGASSYYFDGALVGTFTTDPAPIAATTAFRLGGEVGDTTSLYPYNGWIDEVRYQTFNPLAAGFFNPTAFLIVPEPTAAALLLGAAAILLRRRC